MNFSETFCHPATGTLDGTTKASKEKHKRDQSYDLSEEEATTTKAPYVLTIKEEEIYQEKNLNKKIEEDS